MTINKNIIKNIYTLSWPAILEQLLISFATLLDAAMVGWLGAAATAAVAINITTLWLINGGITAISMGFSFLTARSIGEKDNAKLEKTVRNALMFSLLTGLILGLILGLISFQLPKWLGAEENVVPYAQIYMFIISFGIVSLTVLTVVSGIFRSAGNTKLPFILSLITNTLNFFGNVLLIFPTRHFNFLGIEMTLWGADLGVAGAAISTVVFQTLLALMLIYKLFTVFSPIKISWRGKYHFDRDLIYNMLRICIPVALEKGVLSSGQVVLTAMVASLGTVGLAAHYLTIEIESMLYLPAYGFAFSGLTLIGQSLGAGNKDKAKQYALYLSLIGCGVIVMECFPVYVFSQTIISLFTHDTGIIQLGSTLIKIAAATEIFFSYSIIASGIFRGAGDVKYPLNISIIGMWGIRLSLVYLFVHVFDLGLISVWVAISLDMFFRFIAVIWRLKSGRWLTIWKSQ